METLVHHSRKRLQRLGSLKGVESLALAGGDAEDPAPSPQSSPRHGSGDLVPFAEGDGDGPPIPLVGGAGETT